MATGIAACCDFEEEVIFLMMRSGRLLTGLVLASAALPSLAFSHSRRGPTSQHSFSKHATKPVARPTGQRTIDDGRATQIQTALTGAGYMQGEPTGHWDSSTQAAMQRYQSDHGWQTKLMPDSRAIIKLGLGPSGSADSSALASSMNDKAETSFPGRP